MKALFLALCLLFTACGDGLQPVITRNAATCRTVYMYGDSITNQAGQTIEQFIPCYTIVNHGSDGTMARDMVMPAWSKEAVYTISYGANECLGAVSPDDYRLSLNHILNAGRGYKIVLEAPWRVVDPRCNPMIEQYRTVVVELGKQYSVPVVIENTQEHIGEGIHLTQAHMRERAKLLAAQILKL